jgi:hypothetical protein
VKSEIRDNWVSISHQLSSSVSQLVTGNLKKGPPFQAGPVFNQKLMVQFAFHIISKGMEKFSFFHIIPNPN